MQHRAGGIPMPATTFVGATVRGAASRFPALRPVSAGSYVPIVQGLPAPLASNTGAAVVAPAGLLPHGRPGHAAIRSPGAVPVPDPLTPVPSSLIPVPRPLTPPSPSMPSFAPVVATTLGLSSAAAAVLATPELAGLLATATLGWVALEMIVGPKPGNYVLLSALGGALVGFVALCMARAGPSF